MAAASGQWLQEARKRDKHLLARSTVARLEQHTQNNCLHGGGYPGKLQMRDVLWPKAGANFRDAVVVLRGWHAGKDSYRN